MNTTMHPAAREEIMAFLDGELSVERAQFVSTHIEQCAECCGVRDSLRDASITLSNWTIAAVPARLDEQVKAASEKMPQRGATADSNGFLYIGSWVWKHWVLGLGATAVALVVLFALTNLNYYRLKDTAVTKSTAIDRERASQTIKEMSVDNASAASPTGRAVDAAQIEQVGTAHVFAPPPPAPSGRPQAAEPRVNEPMIARTVSLSIVVKEFEAARAALDGILARHNGYAAGLNVATPESAARTLQASLRIPAVKLAAALSELKALGRVEAETQNGEEVTQQHADLVARLKNSRETEQRLQAILLQRTGKISDVLAVEQEIARVRGEIEQMEAEQQTLEHRVSFATIDLRLAEEYKAQLSSPAPSVGTQLRNATVNGFRNAFEGVLSLVLFFAESGPTLLLWLVILFIPARLLWRRYQRVYATTAFLGA